MPYEHLIKIWMEMVYSTHISAHKMFLCIQPHRTAVIGLRSNHSQRVSHNLRFKRPTVGQKPQRKRAANLCDHFPEQFSGTRHPQLRIPEFSMHVHDLAQLLNPTEHHALTQKIVDFEHRTGSQIAVLTIEHLQGEEMFSFTHRAACEYRLGRQNIGDGLLVVLSKQDRKLWIYTYKAVTPYLSDEQTQSIIDQTMLPWFKKGEFATGLNLGIDEIMSALDGHFPAPRP